MTNFAEDEPVEDAYSSRVIPPTKLKIPMPQGSPLPSIAAEPQPREPISKKGGIPGTPMNVNSTALTVSHDVEARTLFVGFGQNAYRLTPELLHDLGQVGELCRATFETTPNVHQSGNRGNAPQPEHRIHVQGAANEAPISQINYLVFTSRSPAWNLGIDLSLLHRFVLDQDRLNLRDYARSILNVVSALNSNFGLPLVTVALLEGEAFGAGFEMALACDFIIADKNSRFGFPEVLFGSFPGFGAFPLLTRRTTPAIAKRLIGSGDIFTAEQLYELGVVDVVSPDGEVMDAFYALIGHGGSRFNHHRFIDDQITSSYPIAYDQLARDLDRWTDLVLALPRRDLRKIARLGAAQDRRLLRNKNKDRLSA